MDQSSQFNDSDPFFILLLPPPPRSSSISDISDVLSLLPERGYPSKEALFEAIQSWAKLWGYTFSIRRSKRLESGRQKVYYSCDRRASVPLLVQDRTRDTKSRGSECLFSILGIELPGLGWEVKYRPEPRFNTHNHPPSQSPAAHPLYCKLPVIAQNTTQNLFSAG